VGIGRSSVATIWIAGVTDCHTFAISQANERIRRARLQEPTAWPTAGWLWGAHRECAQLSPHSYPSLPSAVSRCSCEARPPRLGLTFSVPREANEVDRPDGRSDNRVRGDVAKGAVPDCRSGPIARARFVARELVDFWRELRGCAR
jgi:hypothetical protein